MAKRSVPKYDLKAFGAAIEAARTGRKESRKKVCGEMLISPRYLANIESEDKVDTSNYRLIKESCKTDCFSDSNIWGK